MALGPLSQVVASERLPRAIAPAVERMQSIPAVRTVINELLTQEWDQDDFWWAMWQVPRARGIMQERVEAAIAETTPPSFPPDWYVVGGGLHGAIAALNLKGTVCIIDPNGVGGVFGLSGWNPAFWLNSRNRPGELGLPGNQDSSLNYLPGAQVQPSMLGGGEYQTNAEMAFCIRMALAARGVGVIPQKVESIGSKGELELSSGVRLKGRRGCVWATGLGEPKVNVDVARLRSYLARRVMTFNDLLSVISVRGAGAARGMERPAVIGANDSGCAAMEFLLGLGPMAPPPRDRIQRVWWLGQRCETRASYEKCARSRYKGLGRSFPKDVGDTDRVVPVPGTVTSIRRSPSSGRAGRWGLVVEYVRDGFGRTSEVFSHIILCTGYEPDMTAFSDVLEQDPFEDVAVEGIRVGRKVSGMPLYLAGPCADLPVTARERASSPALRDIPENSAAVFRYGQRTAMLARSIG
jgi:hypothetical protein